MKIFNTLEEIDNIEETVVALGNFDGVHKGHQQIILRTVKSAEAAGLKSAVFTFSNHPKNLMAGKTVVKNILYPEEKASIIEKLAYCGFNYHFGYKASGTAETLMKEGMKRGFGIHIQEPFEIDGNLVSSTFIRKLIQNGQVDQCMKYMGRLYSIGGEVVVGNKLGRTIGFPTSNIMIDETMVTPPNGVYVTYCVYNGVHYPSITNVGVKPTIGTYHKNVETHIFNFDKELYGKMIRVEFLQKTRDEQKFESVEALSRQITDDCITARSFHRRIAGTY